MKVIKKKISEITPYEKNAKLHPEWQIDQIAESITEFGFNDPIYMDNIVKRYVDYIENPLDQNKVKLIRNGKEYEFLKIRKEMAIFNE